MTEARIGWLRDAAAALIVQIDALAADPNRRGDMERAVRDVVQRFNELETP
jgi:hypothetical protein